MRVTVCEGIRSIGANAFDGCPLEYVSLPATLDYIGPGAFGGAEFYDYDGITLMPKDADSLAGLEFVGAGGKLVRLAGISDNAALSAGEYDYRVASAERSEAVFTGCGGEPADVAVPEYVLYGDDILRVASVAPKALYGCPPLVSVALPDNVAIGSKAFANCPLLNEVVFSENIASLGEDAFGNMKFYSEGRLLEPTASNLAGKSFSVSDGTLVNDEPGAEASVSLDVANLSLSVGESATLVATTAPDTDLSETVTWASSDESVASVDGNGAVTALTEGSATITASLPGGADAVCSVTVTPAESPSSEAGIDYTLVIAVALAAVAIAAVALMLLRRRSA